MQTKIASDLLQKIFEVFKDNSLEYIILRNYEKLPFDNESKDVDILLKSTNKEKTIKLLFNIARDLNYKCIWYNPLDYLHGFVFIKTDSEKLYSVKIDLFFDLKWRGLEYFNTKSILSKSLNYNNFSIPSKEYEALIMIFYYVLYAKNIKDKYTNHIFKYARNDFEEFKKLITLNFDKSLSIQISNLISENKIKELTSLRKIFISKILLKNLNLKKVFCFFNHIKTEYITRKSFGVIIDINNFKEKEVDFLSEVFISLGIKSKNKMSLKSELKNNNIVFTSNTIKDYRYLNLDISKKESLDAKLNELFTQLQKRYKI